MPSRNTVDSVLTDATRIADAWTLNPDFALGAIHLTDVQAAIGALRALDQSIDGKRVELTGLMDQRDDKRRALTDIVTRARSGFRAVYGPDSPQYAMAGGTRRSERKANTPKSETPKAA